MKKYRKYESDRCPLCNEYHLFSNLCFAEKQMAEFYGGEYKLKHDMDVIWITKENGEGFAIQESEYEKEFIEFLNKLWVKHF